MSHTYTYLRYHVIFSTKNRIRCILPSFEKELHAYLGGVVRRKCGNPILINGTEDHVHLLVELSASVALAELMRIAKTNSSKWIHEEKNMCDLDFEWQSGYAAFSVSRSNFNAVYEYIQNQKEHHKKIDFKDELISFLKAHGIVYDPKYIWD